MSAEEEKRLKGEIEMKTFRIIDLERKLDQARQEILEEVAVRIEAEADAVLKKVAARVASDEAVRARGLKDAAAVMRNDAALCRSLATLSHPETEQLRRLLHVYKGVNQRLAARLEEFIDTCPHRDMTLTGDGNMRCDRCGHVEPDPFFQNPYGSLATDTSKEEQGD